MSIYIDRKCLLLISARLPLFKEKKADLFNFRCPYCGDSQKNKTKARGFVYRKNNDYFYVCHNCNVSTTFSKFLQHMDAERYKEYIFERYAAGETGTSNYKKPDIKKIFSGPKPADKFKSLGDFENCGYSIAQLPDGHYAKEYIRARRIPEKFWHEFFYVEEYRNWLDKQFPNHGKENVPNDARIIMFYTDRQGGITNVSGRALAADNKIRYITVKLRDEKKVYGLHRLDPKKRVYVTEGQFDSLFLPNAVASGDSNLISMADHLKKVFGCEDVVLVYDNTPRNKELVSQIKGTIDSGYAVTLLPYDPISKDLNEMVKAGASATDLVNLIDANTYQGLNAQMKFVGWKKC